MNNQNKLNVQEMNLATIRNTNGGMLGAAISKIKITPKGVANAIDYSCKAQPVSTGTKSQ
jgi:pyruvate/2-oxoglutarate dehydrogenase complex dihydrolipoamide acyltransferase (E2) component